MCWLSRKPSDVPVFSKDLYPLPLAVLTGRLVFTFPTWRLVKFRPTTNQSTYLLPHVMRIRREAVHDYCPSDTTPCYRSALYRIIFRLLFKSSSRRTRSGTFLHATWRSGHAGWRGALQILPELFPCRTTVCVAFGISCLMKQPTRCPCHSKRTLFSFLHRRLLRWTRLLLSLMDPHHEPKVTT
jgi:hypothetical protein